jgi:hypothetical protein
MSCLDGPQIVINYSPEMDLRIKCVRVERVYGPSLDHHFEIRWVIRHPSGSFEYSASDLYFTVESFDRFAEELRGIQQGTGRGAALKNLDEMFVLRLARAGMRFQADLHIREYVPPHIVTLASTLELDYDLFVNKLLREIQRFVDELRSVELED